MAEILPESIRILTQAIGKNTEAYTRNYERLEGRVGRTSERREYEAELQARKRLLNLNERERDLQAQLNQEMRDFGHQLPETRNQLQRVQTQLGTFGNLTGTNINQIVTEIREREQTIEVMNKLEKARFKLIHSIQGAKEAFTSFRVSAQLLTAGFKSLYSQVQFALERQVGMYSILTDGLDGFAARVGLLPEQAQQLIASNRQIINASGGVGDVFDTLVQTKDDLFQLTGSFEGANRAALLINQTFREGGVRLERDFSGAVLDATGTLQKLQLMTGQTTEQLLQQQRSLIGTQSMRVELMRLGEQERKARIQDTLGLMKHYVQLGKTTEGAARMLEAMKSFQALSPRERLKEAAKARAIMGAMGLAGGGRMMELAMKPTLTGGEVREQQRLTGGIQAELQRRAGMGGAQMFFAGALQDSLGPGIKGVMDETNMVLDQAKQQTEALSERGAIAKTLIKIKNWTDTVKPFFQDPIISILGGVGISIAGIAKDAATFAAAVKIINPALSVTAGTLGTIAGTAASVLAAVLGVVEGLEAIFTGDSAIARFLRSTFPDMWNNMIDRIEYSMKAWKLFGQMVSDLVDNIIGWFKNVPSRIASVIREKGGPVGKWLVGEQDTTARKPIAAPARRTAQTLTEGLGNAAARNEQQNARLLMDQLNQQHEDNQRVARETMEWQKKIADQLETLNGTSEENLEYSKKSEEEKKDLTKRSIRERRFGGVTSPYATGP